MYDSTPEVTPAILECLSQLSLTEHMIESVRHSVLKTLQAAKPQHLAIIIRFILTVTQHNIAYQVISDIREKMNLPGDCVGVGSNKSQTKTSNEEGDYEVLLFNAIKMATLSHKYLTTAWLKAIQDVGNVGSVRPLDLLLLLLLHDAVPSQRHPIESMIRNKIRAGLLSDAMLGSIFTTHTTVLRENFEALKKIASLLLRSSEPIVSNTGITLYRLSFLHLGKYCRQEVVLGLLRHFGDASNARTAALSLLASLTHNHTQAIAPFTIFIKGSLDCVEDVCSGEMRRVVDVVSLLVFSSPTHSALQDELIILVRKQLSHTDLRYKHLGVLNAAFAVKNMVKVDDNNTTTSTTNTSGLLNTSVLKEAENLLHLVLSSTCQHPTASALFMDEMASITLRDGLNARIQEWVCEKMTDDFQERFVLDYQGGDIQPDTNTLLPLASCWDLTNNDTESEQTNIILNLGPLVLQHELANNTTSVNKTHLVCLTPQFRLLRMLESRLHDGDLTNIDALLGCPVFAPTPSTWTNFTQLTQQQQHAALSCLFHTLNWFREIINAFVTQKDPDLKTKVYQRLQNVIEVQDLLLEHLPHCTSYTPSLATFHLDTSPTTTTTATAATATINFHPPKKRRKPNATKGKKGKKGKDVISETTQVLPSQSNTQLAPVIPTQPTSQTATKKGSTNTEVVVGTLDAGSLRPFLRELHLDVFCLLFRKLALHTDVTTEGLLTLPQAEFLLTDLNFKLAHVFGSGSKRISPFTPDKSYGCTHLDVFTGGEVAQRAHQFLKPICVHLEQINAFFQIMIADNDGVLDADNMFTNTTQPLITLNTQLFNTLYLFFSWSGLQQEEHTDILNAILRTVAKKLEGSEAVKTMGIEELSWSVCRYVSNFQPCVMSLTTATTLCTTLTALTTLPHHQDLNATVVDVIEAVLKRDWYTTGGERDKGATYNQHVNTLLKEYLRLSKDPLKCLENLCSVAVEEFLEATGREPYSHTYPTLNKGTLSIYHRIILSFLVSGTKKSLSTLTNTNTEDRYNRLLVWNSAINILHTTVNILKKHNSKSLLASCLKYGRMFLDVFVRCGMPLLDSCLRAHNQDVVILIKSLQASTRILHHVCTHSKVTQDTSLTTHVPPLKKCLEMLVFRVKAMLAINNCTNAFWMGTLKNRDLHGQEILSQSMREEDDDEDDDNEDDDVNDGQSDVELNDDGDDDDKRTTSSSPHSQQHNNNDDKSTDYSSSF
ncbi:hypothetical protein Pmani_011660 [Petrolisthes manimaculis]|uniref:Fanconi anemia group D2 protein n=1 Tax=Petrolisthes manimaculis TaxID=1843537 RepID=A0AAE1Q0N5_9EUCA|nr:hypothetical protein Pmani_011660 [Petrolisthes manimaculis]